MRLAALLTVALTFLLLAPAQGAQEIVFATYNVENYVGATPKEPGERATTRPKTEEAIAALIRIIKEINPDVLGVCEMGSPERFGSDFKKRLGQATSPAISIRSCHAGGGPGPACGAGQLVSHSGSATRAATCPLKWTESPKRCGAVSSM